MSTLFERGLLNKAELVADSGPMSVPTLVHAASLTFEQQKELLALQFEQEKLRSHFEREEKLELEKMQQDAEKSKLELENFRLQL